MGTNSRPMTNRRPTSYFSGCMSPSCIPVHEEYSRVNTNGGGGINKSRRWRKIIKNLVRESKSIYGSNKPLTFHYDAVSYSQNFDEGHYGQEFVACHHHQVFGESRWPVT